MMTLSGEIAALADELGLGTYRPDGTGGDIFLTTLPPEPDTAIAVSRLRGVEADAKHGYDEPVFLLRVRGPRWDPGAAEAAAQAVYDAMHGLRRRDLPGGTRMLSCHCPDGGPLSAEYDEHGRHEWTVQFEVETRRVTRNRV